MAPSGFFAGGMAEGMATAARQGLAERTAEQDAGLRTRGLDIQERQLNRANAQDDVKRYDGLIADTMTQAAAIIKEGLAVGKTPAELLPVVQHVVDTAKPLAAKVGRDPAALDAQVRAMLTGATGIQTATAAGAAEGTKEVSKEATLTAAGYDGLGKWKTLDEKVKAEGALRDDYLKQSKDFTTIRDFKDRIDNAASTGAGDLALVFSYMKLLDPGSTVREGEFRTASQIAGLPGIIETLRNKILGQGQLGEDARKDIRAASENIWKKANDRQSNLTNRFASIAKKNRLDVNSVVIDPVSDDPGSAPLKTPGGTTFRILP